MTRGWFLLALASAIGWVAYGQHPQDTTTAWSARVGLGFTAHFLRDESR